MNTREQFGKYLLLKKLTEDPIGETFRAGLLGAKGMERVVLLRIFNGQGIDGNRLWQIVESRQGMQQALKSPNIGDGVELGQIEGIPYVAYDYVSGKNMANLLEQAARKRNFVPAEHALLITERLALGLASAAETRFQDQRISHGFLVPHLVIISNEGETRLLGFEVGPGLRSFAANPVVRQHFGRYLSPEALSGAPLHKVDDIYSLGVVLFELLTGRPLPPPAADGYGSVIDQGVVATEGEPIPEELRNLLKKSLVARDQRIQDVVEWHKALNKYMFEGSYNPTTFNLAFFMHNLFRQEIERESQEIEIEKTLPVPTVGAQKDEAPAADPESSAVVAEGDSTGAVPVPAGEVSGVHEVPKKSNTGMIVGALAALLLVAVAAWFFLGRGGSDAAAEQAAASQPAPPPPEPQGPSVEDIRSQMQELIAQQSEMLQAQYDDKLKELQDQLDDAQAEAERRRKADEERKQREAKEQAQAEAEAEAQRLAEEKQKEDEARKLAEAKKKAEEEAAKKEEEAEVAEAKKTAVPTPTPTPRPTTPTPQGQQAEKPKPEPKVRRGDLVEYGPGVTLPKSKRSYTPKYPEMARRFNKTSATVLVRALIDENGDVIKAELASKPQKFGFDQEAISAVKKSTYEPATKDGVPVKYWHTVTVQFRR